MNPNNLQILQHSLGVDQFGQGPQFRNHFITDNDAEMAELVALGYVHNCGSNTATGGMNCYRVTPEGKTAMREHSPKPPKLSRSQKRYRAFLNADSGMTFFEYMKA